MLKLMVCHTELLQACWAAVVTKKGHLTQGPCLLTGCLRVWNLCMPCPHTLLELQHYKDGMLLASCQNSLQGAVFWDVPCLVWHEFQQKMCLLYVCQRVLQLLGLDALQNVYLCCCPADNGQLGCGPGGGCFERPVYSADLNKHQAHQ